jgi:transcription elongation GreA/GreB family factor
MVDKAQLKQQIIKQLEAELANAVEAATNAHLAAIDEQSVAETQYDTLAIEAAYLAEGLSKRIDELKAAIHSFQALALKDYDFDSPLGLGALIQFSQDEHAQHWYFIAPAKGGLKVQLGRGTITLITPHSPMGQALVGNYGDDDIFLPGQKQPFGQITTIS